MCLHRKRQAAPVARAQEFRPAERAQFREAIVSAALLVAEACERAVNSAQLPAPEMSIFLR